MTRSGEEVWWSSELKAENAAFVHGQPTRTSCVAKFTGAQKAPCLCCTLTCASSVQAMPIALAPQAAFPAV